MNTNRREFLRNAGLGAIGTCMLPRWLAADDAPAAPAATPNIVYILADDLGYGDVKYLNPQGKIATPNLDKLGQAGVVFTDAHSSSSVCTPTRYGILTGRYNWRSRLKSGVLQGFSPRLIEDGRLTVPTMLKQKGYATACFGKWHLGMDMAQKDETKTKAEKKAETKAEGKAGAGWDIDYTKPIANAPTSLGFDYYFGIAASLDMPPFVFIENDRFTAVPTVEKHWLRKGPAAKEFEAIDVLPTLTKKVGEYLDQHAADAKAGKPFFLYMPLNAPHTPILPTPEWKGKSGISDYCDFVMQVDWTVGQVLAALDRNGLAENTLVIFTSDNGCSPAAGFPEMLAKGHNPSYVYRGHKADIFDGGHRIPFLARWPGKIKPGSTSNQLICLTDLMATAAEITGFKLPETAGEDSVSILPALTGTDNAPLREAVVHHSINGSFSIRQGQWKLELCPDSGGWSAPKPGSPAAQKLPPIQLYDLATDIGEQTNVYDKHPDVVAKLTKLLEKYVADGRSTPGAPQPNTGEVNIHRVTRASKKQQAALGTLDKE